MTQDYFKFTTNEAYKSITSNKTDTAPTQAINMAATAPKVALPAVEPRCFYGEAGGNVKNCVEYFEVAATANHVPESNICHFT